MADWNSPRILLWFLFQHPRLFATAICIQVLGWPRFVHLELLPYGPIQTQSPSRHPCKLTRAFGPRNSMKIAQSQAIIQNGWEWRDRKDNGDAEAECKFDPERA